MARRPIRAQADQSRWRTWSSYKPVTVHQASCWAMMRSKPRRMGRRIAEGQLCTELILLAIGLSAPCEAA